MLGLSGHDLPMHLNLYFLAFLLVVSHIPPAQPSLSLSVLQQYKPYLLRVGGFKGICEGSDWQLEVSELLTISENL